METEKEKPVEIPSVFVEDGITFLSTKELDDYREQRIMLAWAEGAYV